MGRDIGGKLLITGQTGQYDRDGNLQANSALEALIGSKKKGRLASLDNWVLFAPADTHKADSALNAGIP